MGSEMCIRDSTKINREIKKYNQWGCRADRSEAEADRPTPIFFFWFPWGSKRFPAIPQGSKGFPAVLQSSPGFPGVPGIPGIPWGPRGPWDPA